MWPKPIDGLSANLKAVDNLMLDSVGKSALGKAAAALITSGGKRLRPALALTAASISGKKPRDIAVRTAAAIELIHLASIVHDDILDKSPLRRGTPAAAAAQGAAFAILLGDFLLAKAFSEAALVNGDIANILAKTVADMAEVETANISEKIHANPLSQKYKYQVELKTAGLFRAAAASGAFCADSPVKNVKALEDFGENFGFAFQIIDDLQDSTIPADLQSKAMKEIKIYNSRAIQSLAVFDGQAADSLRALPDDYLAWALPR